MSVKKIILPDLGEVSLYKRRGAKTMRLSISHEGDVRLTIPKWTPYSAGILFINNNLKWISDHITSDKKNLGNNMRVGKAHVLVFENDTSANKITTRVRQNQVRVVLPVNVSENSTAAQKSARTAVLRTLKYEAEQLLPKRLDSLAKQFGFNYSGIRIRQLKSRWGSCNNLKQITLNFYLIQLPWELIDYVILHELTHTKVLSHGPKFWDELSKDLPDAKKLKKQINSYKPTITNLSLD